MDEEDLNLSYVCIEGVISSAYTIHPRPFNKLVAKQPRTAAAQNRLESNHPAPLPLTTVLCHLPVNSSIMVLLLAPAVGQSKELGCLLASWSM